MASVCLQCDGASAVGSPGAPCPRCGVPLVELVEDDPLVGTTIDGRFEIVGLLGRGGMGSVYRAIQKSIGRAVALKFLDQRAPDAAAAKRFFREAKLASTLAHPNTVAVIDFGQSADGRLYLVMELVAGRTLHDVLEADGAFPTARIVRIGTQLCDVLEAAHALGIVHRDLKPENVIVGERDHVKLLDFGLARMADDPTMRATATGVYAGTPRYMPPETATGAEPSPSQDIYALGVILAELATDQLLFAAPTIEALFTKKLSPAEELAGIARPLLGVIERMVAPLPGDRPTAAAVRDALATLVSAPAIASSPRARSIGLEMTATGPVQPPTASRVEEMAGLGSGLEVDPDWQREREQATGHVNTGRPPRPSTSAVPIVAILVALVVLGGGGVGAWWWWSHRAAPAVARNANPVATTPHANVAIHITASPDVEIAIDGKRAGKTPLTLDHARGTQPIRIGVWGGTGTLLEVVPDRDREVDLSPR